jgi:hypothetical protein
MMQPKFLVAAFVFVGMLTTSGIANAESRFYVEVGASFGDPDDVTAEFTRGNENAIWGLDRMNAAKLQVGGDFGMFRTDLKLRAFQGDVSTISGASAIGDGSKAFFGMATVNGYVDIHEFKLGVGDASITPYIGIGGGVAGGFLEGDGTVAGQVRVDHRQSKGMAVVGTLGALFSINKHVGLSAEYERINTDAANGFDINTYGLGLRVTF